MRARASSAIIVISKDDGRNGRIDRGAIAILVI